MTQFAGLFDGVAPAIRAEFDALKRPAHFASGENLFTAGERPSWKFRINAGRVKVWRPGRTGGALTLYCLSHGDPAGLASIARGATVSVTMTAASAVEADRWPAPSVFRLLGEDAQLARNGLRIAGVAMEVLTDRLEDVTGARVAQQIARALLRLAGEHARWGEDNCATVDVSRQELADLTATTLYTASRTLSDWGRQGLVESLRGRVVILDCPALARIAGVEG